MQIALPLLALLVTPALLRGEIIYNSRLLLATEDDVFDEGDTSEANTVYQQAGSLLWLGSRLLIIHLTVLMSLTQSTSLSCLRIGNSSSFLFMPTHCLLRCHWHTAP